MSTRLLQKSLFWGKSLLWSAVLYIAAMFIINWDDVTNGFPKGNDGNITVVHTLPVAPLPTANAPVVPGKLSPEDAKPDISSRPANAVTALLHLAEKAKNILTGL